MEDKSGTVIRGYELRSLLGEGGFGAVYRAYQPAVKREVALKVILPEYASHPDFIRSFESEAQIIARLEHLHIVPLYDFWRDPDGAFIVMRFLRGGSLSGLIRQGPLALDKAAAILDQVSSALQSAHRQGIVHRDIKPDNILVDEDHNAFLTDFGIALDLEQEKDDDDFDDSLTGSPHYISPEQAQQDPVSGRSDIYSLGIVLFEILTGQAPFAGNTTMMELILKQINEPLPPIQTLNPDIPDEVDLVIQRATSKDPDARYPDVLSFAAAFRASVPSLAATAPVVEAATTEDEELIELVIPGSDNPYKGLRPFEEADSDDFFGRDALIARLLKRVTETRFLAVIGPSGSGKSSVVKAGLVPSLKKGKVEGADRWFYAEMVPGTSPFQELESALLSIAASRHPNLRQQMRGSDDGLLEAVNKVLPDQTSQFLLMIDQFEEVFTQVDDNDERAAFLNNILVATSSPNSRLRVIITMRADFYDRPLLYPGFGELIRRYSEVVLPLDSEDMAKAIIGPAERIGMHVESALSAAIIAEIEEQPGALPLLQYALTEVFERRKGNRLTYEAYQQSGGVLGALARRAEEIYVQLGNAEQETTRQIFLRLVTLGEGAEDTRRRVTVSDLLSMGENETATQHVLDTYTRYRLLTFDKDPVTREPTVEVAHEALIREWQRLREWLNESRDDVRTQQRLATAARNWIGQNRDNSFLADGMRLQQFEQLLNRGRIALTEDEITYTQSSIAERDRKAKEETERQERERQLEQRAKQRLQIGIGVFIVAFIVALALAGLAVSERSAAVEARDEAENNEATAVIAEQLAVDNAATAESASLSRATAVVIAETERITSQLENARLLAFIALQQRTEDPIASVNLALRGIPDTSDDVAMSTLYVPEAEFALSEGIKYALERTHHFPLQLSPDDVSLGVSDVAFNDTQVAYIGANEVVVSDYTLANITPLQIDLENRSQSLGVEWSADNRLLSYGRNPNDTYSVFVWENNDAVNSFESPGETRCATWSPDASTIAICVGGATNSVIVWNPETNARITLRPLEDDIKGATFTPDGQTLVLYTNTTLTLWDTVDEAERITLENPHVSELSTVDPIIDGVQVIGNDRFVSYALNGTLLLWNTDGEIIQDLTQDDEGIIGLAISPGATGMLVYQNGGIVRGWNITNEPFELAQTLIPRPDANAAIQKAAWYDDAIIAIADPNGVVDIWELTTQTKLTTLYGHNGRVRDMQWFDNRYILTVGESGSTRIWEVFNENGVANGALMIYRSSQFDRGLLENVRWLTDEIVLAIGNDGYPRRYNVVTGVEEVFDDADHARWRVVWGAEGREFIWYDDRGGRIELWDFDAREMRFGIDDIVTNVFWLENGIYYTDRDGRVKWIDEAGNLLAEFAGNAGRINDIRFSNIDNRLAIAEAVVTDNAPVNIYDLPADDELPASEPLEPRVSLDTENRIPVRLTWYEDGVRLASIGFNGDVQLWDTTRGTRLSLGVTGAGDFPGRDAAVFSPDLEYISAAIDDEIVVFDFAGNIIFRRTEGNAVRGTDWITHDSRQRLLTWGSTAETGRGFVSILDLDFESGEMIEVWRTEAVADVSSAAINSDGTEVVIGGGDRRAITFRVWPSIAEMVNTATTCCTTRDLSDEQRLRFNIKD